MRIGTGYDAHRLMVGRTLVLGGVTIPYALGLLGHSDADVLTHAIGDALLGALALGDLGRHFPDTDPQYTNISSLILLERIMEKINAAGWEVGNVDSTILADKPRLAEHIPTMQQNLARVMKVNPDQVSVKATTTEGLGYVGRGEGIAAMAVAILVPIERYK